MRIFTNYYFLLPRSPSYSGSMEVAFSDGGYCFHDWRQGQTMRVKYPRRCQRVLAWGEEHHPLFPVHLFCKLLNRTIFNAGCHAVLNTCGLHSLLCPCRTQDTQLRRKGEIDQVGLVIRKTFYYFHDFHACHARRPAILLRAGNLAGVATGAVFIIDEKSVFALF